MHRGTILEKAHEHTIGDKDVEYGSPVKTLGDTARLWNAYMRGKYGTCVCLTAEDVAHFNVLQKQSRTFAGNVKADTYEDAAAYSAIAGECAEPDTEDAHEFIAPKAMREVLDDA